MHRASLTWTFWRRLPKARCLEYSDRDEVPFTAGSDPRKFSTLVVDVHLCRRTGGRLGWGRAVCFSLAGGRGGAAATPHRSLRSAARRVGRGGCAGGVARFHRPLRRAIRRPYSAGVAASPGGNGRLSHRVPAGFCLPGACHALDDRAVRIIAWPPLARRLRR